MEKLISGSKLHFEKSIAKLILFFKKNELNVNESKIKFIIFGASTTNKIGEIVVNGWTVLEKKFVKFLGVHIDCNLSFDEEMKNFIPSLTPSKIYFQKKTGSALLNALVLSHLHYPIVLFSVFKKSLRVTLNKQLNRGKKGMFQ